MERVVLNMDYKYLRQLRASLSADFKCLIFSALQLSTPGTRAQLTARHRIQTHPSCKPCTNSEAPQSLCSQTVPPGQDGETWGKPGPFNRQGKQLTKGRRIFRTVLCTAVNHPGSGRITLVVKLTLIKKTLGSGQTSGNT